MDSSMNQNFSFCITYNDDTGLWPNVWNSLKDQLSIHFANIKFKDNLNTMKTLSSLNLKMGYTHDTSQLHLYIMKINTNNDLKGGNKERILSNLERYKTSFIINLMDIENSDSNVKNALKNFDKIKTELKNPDMKLLPVFPMYGKHNDIISDFFVFFKLRISNEINQKMNYYIKQIDTFKFSKFENKESAYNYLACKDSLSNYLQMGDFWFELQKYCEDDLFVFFNGLNDGEIFIKNNSKCDLNSSYYPNCLQFHEPSSLLDFDETLVLRKIKEKNISNIYYQQYLFYQLFKTCKFLRDFRKINFYFTKILTDLTYLKNYFVSKYHFYFWAFQYTCRLIPFAKSLKSGIYSNYDDEINVRSQLNVFYHMKKNLKNFSQILKFDIPNMQIFCEILNKKILDEAELKNQFNKIIKNYDEIQTNLMENDNSYNSFLKDIKENLDEKSRTIIFEKYKLIDEYLNILSSIEKLHLSLNQNKLAMRIQIEKLPLLLITNKHSTIRSTLMSIIKVIKKDKWDFLFEFLNFILIVFINCMEKNEENLKIILEFLKIKFKQTKEFYQIFNIENEQTLNEILSKYLQNYKLNNRNLISNPYERNVINFNNILQLKFKYSSSLNVNSNEIIGINLFKDKIGHFDLFISNESKLNFKFSKFIFIFKDELNSSNINHEYFNEEIAEIAKESELNHSLEINFEEISHKIENIKDKINQNCLLTLTDIKFIINSGIEGVYNLEKDNIKINIKTNNLEISSKIKINRGNEEIDANPLLYYNTLYPLILEFKNFQEFDFSDKIIKIKINTIKEDCISDSSVFKLNRNKFNANGIGDADGMDFTLNEYISDKIKIENNELTISDGISFEKIGNYLVLELFFLVEDSDFYKSFDKKIEVITQINSIHNSELNNELENGSNNESNNNLFYFKETHSFSVIHIFSLTHKMRIQKNNYLLLQTSINLNLEKNGIKILINNSNGETKNVEVNVNHSFNLIKFVKNDLVIDFENIFFNYEEDDLVYYFYYPENTIKDKVFSISQLPYYIKINFDSSKDTNQSNIIDSIKNGNSLIDNTLDGLKLFQEFNISINIRKYIKDDVLIMIKIKENDNWSIVGKSRMIERIISPNENENFIEIQKIFTIIPLEDGYVKLPDIDFMEYKISGNNYKDIKNINSLEFLPINVHSIIEGNEKIVKVYSINSCALKLNYI